MNSNNNPEAFQVEFTQDSFIVPSLVRLFAYKGISECRPLPRPDVTNWLGIFHGMRTNTLST